MADAGVLTVLLVEDDDQVRRFMRGLLSGEGYNVIEARNGAEGLKIASEIGRIDLLLADMLLPELSGFDLAEQLLEARPGLKILFVTGYIEGDIVQRSIAQ